ncbi:MAG TPA: SRPBCC domain-containing protein [Cyclobacteriaceae bacterium]
MELKTKVDAEEGKQDLFITREFDLPLELVFRAYTEADLLEQWMGTKVEKLENRKGGGYHLVTTDPKGNKYVFRGAVHDFVPNAKIVRTFEMENAPLGVQLEVILFERLTDDTSRLTMHTIYESNALRDQQLQMPFKQGINIAHKRMEEIMSKLK